MKKQYITNKAGERIFPYTHLKAVLDDNGNSLDTLLALLASPTVGTTAERNAMILKAKDVGFQFFDTSLKKPVYVAAVSADGLATWVNATGAAESYMVTYNLSNVHLIEDKKSATASINYSTTIEEDDGYALPSGITVKVNGVSLIPVTDYTYDSETGEIVIGGTSVNGPIVIEATGADPNEQGGGGMNPGQGV
jgi:hypothetical protein